MANLLIIDDDLDFTRRLARGLRSEHTVTCLDETDTGLPERLAAGEFAAVLLDNRLPKMTGLAFLQLLEERGVTVPVILVTDDCDLNTAIDATKRRAFDYVQKRPMEELLKVLKPLLSKALEIFSQGPPIPVCPDVETEEACAGPQLICPCPEMNPVRAQIARAIMTVQPVLIQGEAGTGKDLVARAIHANGPRCDKPFVVVRCHTFDEASLRDQLFGHEIGFRGEGKLRKGKIEYSSGGTLYLDEVGALPRALQDDLLSVLEEGQVTRLGDNEPIAVDVRVIAASRCNLKSLPESKFRHELRSRLSNQTIILPSLRHRTGDLKPLVNHFLRREAVLAGKKRVPTLKAECWSRLEEHEWPGNVRELQNVIRKAVVDCRGPKILAQDLRFDEPNSEVQLLAGLRLAISSALSSDQNHLYGWLLDMLRKELVTLALEKYKGDAREAETRLGVSLDQICNPDEPPIDDEPPTEKLPKAVERRMRALVLIQTFPAWTVVQYARKLGCAKATLERDQLIKQALKLRKDDLRLPHGFKNRNGTIDAYSEHEDADFEDE